MERFDAAVVGGGLAGTTLAWSLRWKGFRVAVSDRGSPDTPSRVAAGLITPVTGRRLAATPRYGDLFPAAADFYRRVEAETGAGFFTRRPVVRLFRDDRERAVFLRKKAAEFRGLVAPGEPAVNGAWFAGPFGGFEMPAAGQLDAPRYLDASRDRFRADGGYFTADVTAGDFVTEPGAIRLPRLGLEAGRVIFCQGIEAARNPLCGDIRFEPAKGEILTLRVPGLGEDRVVNRGVWLAPAGGETFRAGSTYDRIRLDSDPTPAGREEIGSRLREFLRLPFEVVGHAAAVRPIAAGRRPVLGLHPGDDRFGFFNGLGSKGALLAPSCAAHFAGFLAGDHPLAPDGRAPCGD